MIDPQLAAFAVVAAGLTLAPGADTLLVMKNTLRGGRDAGLATTLGISAGLWVHALMSALGISVLLAQLPGLLQGLKLVGALYLAWLGLQAWRHARASPAVGTPASPGGVRAALIEGLLTNLLNPKVVVFYLAFLPQFIAPGQAVLPRSLLLAGIHVGFGLAWLGALSLALARGRDWATRPRVQTALARLSGLLLIGLGLRLALDSR